MTGDASRGAGAQRGGGARRIGIGAGAVVALMLRNDLAALEAMLALRRAGCYAVPVNWHFKAEEAGYILRDSGACALVIHADLLPHRGRYPGGRRHHRGRARRAVRDAFGLAPEQCRAPAGLLEWQSFVAAPCPMPGRRGRWCRRCPIPPAPPGGPRASAARRSRPSRWHRAPR